jgi:hypothetical protein
MNLGEILDRTFEIYRSGFWAFVAVGLMPALVVRVLRLTDAHWFHLFDSAVRNNDYAPGRYMTSMVFSLGYYHFSSFVGLLLYPVVLKLASGKIFNEETSIREGFKLLGSRWKSFLWLATLKLVIGLVIVEVLTAVSLGLTMDGLDALGAESFLNGLRSDVVVGLWVAAGFATFLWIGSALSLSIPAAIFEGLMGFRALRRSWKLTRTSRRRIALAWLTVATASWLLSTSFQWLLRSVVALVLRAAPSHWVGYTLYPILSQVLNTVLATVVAPIYPIAVTLFYYDQRIRLEGYDIERMMTAAGLNPTAPLTPDPEVAVPSAPASVNPEAQA